MEAGRRRCRPTCVYFKKFVIIPRQGKKASANRKRGVKKPQLLPGPPDFLFSALLIIMDDRHILTVSELNRGIRSLLESRYPFISVAGEVSNMHRPYSGHIYFTLKDSEAQLKAVLFKMQQRYLAAPLKDGDHVVCRGRISVYEPRGDYQLIVDTIACQGAGVMQQAFLELKERLAAEGLFDEAHKRLLPPFPGHIALVTSPQGAAVHDFIRIATRRWPGLRLSVYPVSVQGNQAAGEMIQAIADLNQLLRPDLIILCRGGGAMEDLWCFNDEQLARAIYASAIPVVSAVGHEIDFTIADFAADLRAPTPSGAAELCTPEKDSVRRQVQLLGNRLLRRQRSQLQGAEYRLRLLTQRLVFMPHPPEQFLLRLDELTARLQRSLQRIMQTQQYRLDQVVLRLAHQNPVHRLHLADQRLRATTTRLLQAGQQSLQTNRERFQRAVSLLHALSPLATLGRGYAIARTTGPKPRVIRQAAQVQPGDTIETLLHRGTLRSRVEKVIMDKEKE